MQTFHRRADYRNEADNHNMKGSFRKMVNDESRSLSPILKNSSNRNNRKEQRKAMYDNWTQNEAIPSDQHDNRRTSSSPLRQDFKSTQPVMQMGALAKSIIDLEKFTSVYNQQ